MDKEIVYRTLEIESTRADDKTRTVQASLSSEEPVERFFGSEILSHEPASVDMSRAADGLPLLFSHDPDQIVGKAENIRVDNARLRATLRFGNTTRASELWSLVRDGILTGVSIGYRILKMEQTGETDSGETIFTALRWQPLETSLVAVPADISVGVGRSRPTATLTLRGNAMETDINITNKLAKAERTGAYHEKERCMNINAIAAMNAGNTRILEAAQEAIANGTPVETFQRTIPAMFRAQPLPLYNDITSIPKTHLGLSRREVGRFSILRAVNAVLLKDWRHAGFELECSRSIQDKLDRQPRGFYVPWDVQAQGQWSRAVPMDTGDNSDLVATDHLAANFIAALQPISVVLNAGATTLPGLVGNVDIPKFSTGSSFTWLAEDGDSQDTEPGTATVSLSPKTVSGSVPLTRRLIKQSTPAVELLVRADLTAGAASAIDAAAIQGTGASNQPTGIVNVTGVNTETITTPGQPAWADIVNFESAVATDNALSGSLRYLMTPAVVGHCKVTSVDSGSGRFIIENNSANGYPVLSTANVPQHGIVFGDFSSLLIGFWGVLDINVDTATKAVQGGTVLRAFQDVDIAVRHAVSFCINA